MGRKWAIGRWRVRRQGVQECEDAEVAGSGSAGSAEACEAINSANVDALRSPACELDAVLEESQCEIAQLGNEFEAMAQATHAMVESAEAIVSCAAGERLSGVLAAVQGLSTTTRSFLEHRLASTAGMVETVAAEEALLTRLAQLTRAQKAIVRETAVLRVLTNIEVARLGEVGAGFEYLARELDDFATAVAESIAALTCHTEQRRSETEAMQQMLRAELPQIQEEYGQLGRAMDSAQAEMDATLTELQQTPGRFQGCVAEIAQQISGVVAAIQAHDITRQQMEHVRAALLDMNGEMEEGDGAAKERAAALTIQSYQIRSIQATVEGWMGQIRGCLEAIAQLATNQILDLGRGVLGRERLLESEVCRIEQLEEQCAADNARVQASFAGIAGLMQLVSEHLARSREVRERLQLLMFNSIVEASHLGTQADGILEISNTIKRLSSDWSGITHRSEEAMEEIRRLVEENQATMAAFSGGAQEALREARERTRAGLEVLRETARCAESRGQQIQQEAGQLQGRVAEVRMAGEQLERCFSRLGRILAEVDRVRDNTGRADGWDAAAMERRFGSTYTTEMEREVLRAALDGAPLPTTTGWTGNAAELF